METRRLLTNSEVFNILKINELAPDSKQEDKYEYLKKVGFCSLSYLITYFLMKQVLMLKVDSYLRKSKIISMDDLKIIKQKLDTISTLTKFDKIQLLNSLSSSEFEMLLVKFLFFFLNLRKLY